MDDNTGYIFWESANSTSNVQMAKEFTCGSKTILS